MEIHFADIDIETEEIKSIFKEYAHSLGSETCLQNFEYELEHICKIYGKPKGCVLLARMNEQVIGCVALKQIGEKICEMKRLFVKPEFQGKHIGKILVKEVMEFAKKVGYHTMKLDTLKSMKIAIKLYKSVGFVEIPPYVINPLADAVYMEMRL